MIIPEKAVLRASQWCYGGVWSFFTKWFLVPECPPHLEGADDRDVKAFRPAEGFLRYLKFFFWIGLVAFDGLLFVGWIALLISKPWLGILLTVPIWIVMVVPDIVAYIAIHLRYDTTWYVLSDRSMRIRRGIWIIHETTITYDNIQNVSIKQGPLERYFDISNVLVETAGGGSSAGSGDGKSALGHAGLLEGISNAKEVRQLILDKWQQSKSSGLGDEHRVRGQESSNLQRGFSEEQAKLLEEVRDLVGRLGRL